MRVGGEQGAPRQAYDFLRRAVGTGGSAADDRGIEGLWRRSIAKGYAVGLAFLRRAAYNLRPSTCTDLLPYYEWATGEKSASGTTEATRRDAVTAAWTSRFTATIADLSSRLKEIDSRFSVVTQTGNQIVETVPGRPFLERWIGAPSEHPQPAVYHNSSPFSPLDYSLTPNFSTAFRVHVLFTVGYMGQLNPADSLTYAQAQRYLNSVLPTWCDFQIMTALGFVLDNDPTLTPDHDPAATPLGLTGMTDI